MSEFITIPLTQGKAAIVDTDDLHLIAPYTWCASVGFSTTYAVSGADEKRHLMHRLILDAPDGLYVDHVDGNGLNNRRSNLRVATNAQNQMNTGKQVNNTSGYKGVSFYRRHRKWQAQIAANGSRNHLGFYDTAEDAARAYDLAALKLHGAFARINFPEEATR